jgi:hypothetical protein
MSAKFTVTSSGTSIKVIVTDDLNITASDSNIESLLKMIAPLKPYKGYETDPVKSLALYLMDQLSGQNLISRQSGHLNDPSGRIY